MATDGRRARGEASRSALIDAALAVLRRDGAAGLTHRAIAQEADVAAATITYHFGGLDELLVGAIRRSTERWSAALATSRSETYPRELAALLVQSTSEHHARFVADIELYLLAARRPALRAAATAWADTVNAPLGDLDDVARRTFMAAVDGICIQLLLAAEPLDVDTVAAVLEHAAAHAGDHAGAA